MCVFMCLLLSVSNFLQPHRLYPRQDYWSGVPFPSPGDLLIFPTQGSSLHPLHWQADPLPLSHQGSQSEGEGYRNGLPCSMAAQIYPLNHAIVETSSTRLGGIKGEVEINEVASEREMMLRKSLTG